MANITVEQLRELASYAAKGTAPTNYEFSNVNDALRDEFKSLCGSINKFNQNKYLIFEILIQNADEIVPAKVIDAMGIFAEIQQVGQGQKAMFKANKGKSRARKFLTQVGLSGVYETFRLDKDTYSVSAIALGGGVSIDFERMLDGAETLSDVMDILTTGFIDAVYAKVQATLRAAYAASAPTANRVSTNGFDSAKMFKLISTVKAYGGMGAGAVIFAPPEFIAEIGADAIVPVGTGAYQGVYHPQDIDAIHNTGYINLFRGTPIVQMPQSFIDEKNTQTWIDPQLAYVLPTGGERVVKVVFEGETQMWDRINADQSIEIMAYKKMGCSIETLHNWGIYQNTSITQTMYSPYVNI